MSTLRHDLVYGLRVLARKPLFTLVIALSLAVGIGLNTAIFTLMNSILLRSRTREIGIRMALGAGGWDVVNLIFRQALVVIAAGAAAGIAGATALTRFISSQIWEVKTTDPGTFARAWCRRGGQCAWDPTNALRHE